MITFRVTTDVQPDRRVTLTLPTEVPTGRAELVVSVNATTPAIKPSRTSLADWAEANAELWGERLRADEVESFTGRRF